MNSGIKQTKEMIKVGIRTYLAKNEDGGYVIDEINRLPFFMIGLPGIGKTAIVKQIADEMGIGYVSFSLTHHTRNSLLGLPVIKELEDGGKYTEYTMSEIIAAVYKECDMGHNEGILMLDEFNCASETILPAMLSFLQNKNIGEYKLPEGWCIVLAGNPSDINRSAKNLDTALTDRVRKINIEFKADDFLEYAREKKFHPVVMDYLNSNHENIYILNTQSIGADPVTARGWENLSNTIYAYEQLSELVGPELIFQFIKNYRVAMDFANYYAMTNSGCGQKDIEKILRGVETENYAEKFKNMPVMSVWAIVDYIGRILSDGVRGKKLVNSSDNGVTNMFELVNRIDEPILSEHFFSIVNQDEKLVKMLTLSGNKSYKDACKKYCKVA